MFPFRFRSVLTTAVLAATLSPALRTQDNSWLRDIVVEGRGVITVYQPQPGTFKGNRLTGRAAMSFTPTGKVPVFGAFWFTAEVETDRDARTALVRGIKVTQVKWPNASDAGRAEFTKIMEDAAPETMEFSLERFEASLATAAQCVALRMRANAHIAERRVNAHA